MVDVLCILEPPNWTSVSIQKHPGQLVLECRFIRFLEQRRILSKYPKAQIVDKKIPGAETERPFTSLSYCPLLPLVVQVSPEPQKRMGGGLVPSLLGETLKNPLQTGESLKKKQPPFGCKASSRRSDGYTLKLLLFRRLSSSDFHYQHLRFITSCSCV